MGSEKTYIFDGGNQGGGLDIAALVSSMMGNKGMDPNLVAALMNGNNNRGAWGGDGCWWIWIILLFFCWGGNGFGGFGNNGAAGLPAQLNGDAGRELLMNAIQGNSTAINQLSASLNCSTQQIQSTLCNIESKLGMSGQQIINAVQSLGCQIGNQIAECCCNVRQDIVKMGYDNQLATINQTNTLQATSNSQFNILGAKIDAQTQILNDRFCQLEMREMQNKIDTLRQENANLALSASQQAQTSNIVNQLRQPCPVPAYIVQNPNCCNPPTVAVATAPTCANTLF